MRNVIVLALLFLAPCLGPVEGALGASPPKPNVLLIGIDDLNDWIGCLGGHPQAQTPHLDALAERGVLAGVAVEGDYPELEGGLLVAVTESNPAEDLERLIRELGDSVEGHS